MKRKATRTGKGWVERKLANPRFREGFEKELWELAIGEQLQTDPKFGKLILSRRKQSTRSLHEVRARLRRRK